MTVLWVFSSYRDRPSLPAPVMKVIRIISVRGRGSVKADSMVVDTVDLLLPARSNVSLSVAARIDAAIPLTLEDAIVL